MNTPEEAYRFNHSRSNIQKTFKIVKSDFTIEEFESLDLAVIKGRYVAYYTKEIDGKTQWRSVDVELGCMIRFSYHSAEVKRLTFNYFGSSASEISLQNIRELLESKGIEIPVNAI